MHHFMLEWGKMGAGQRLVGSPLGSMPRRRPPSSRHVPQKGQECWKRVVWGTSPGAGHQSHVLLPQQGLCHLMAFLWGQPALSFPSQLRGRLQALAMETRAHGSPLPFTTTPAPSTVLCLSEWALHPCGPGGAWLVLWRVWIQ